MLKNFRLAAVLAAVLFASSVASLGQSPAFAQGALKGGPPAPADKAPRGVWPQTYSDIKADPAVRFATLPNGMRYAIMKNATPSGQASIRLRFDAGSFMERDDQQGLAHFIEHMAFNGSKKVPEGDMIKILERLGLAFGADTNASTGFTETIYQLDLPRTNDETVDTSLMLMREAASELLIDPAAIDRERGVVLSEERTRDSPGLRVFMAQMGFLMPDHLVTKRMPIGKVDVLRTAQRKAFTDYYNAYYRPERAVLVMVGDFDPDAIEAKIKATFSDWKAVGPAGPEPRLIQSPRRGPSAKVLVEPGAQLALMLAWTSAPDLSPDTLKKRQDDLTNMLGFAVLNRRLERIARGGDPPFISAGGGSDTEFRSIDMTSLSVSAQPGRWREALSAVEQEQRRLVQFGVQQAELDREIDQLRAALKARTDAMATRRTPGLADELISTIDSRIVQTNPAQDLELFEQQVKNVNAASVSAAMRQAFEGSGPLVFLSTPTPVEGGDATLLAALNQSRAVAVTAGATLAAKTWPYDNFGPAGQVAERREEADIATTFVRFANGVRLTVKPTTFRDDEIDVAVRVGDGRLSMPTDRMSVSWAAPSAFIEGGLAALNAEEIDDILRSRIVGSAISIDDDAVVLAGGTRPQDLDTQLQLLAAYVTAPGWRPEAFQRIKSVGATIHDQQDATANGVMGRELSGLLHAGDTRFGFPTRADIANSKPEDLQSLLKTQLASGPIEVLVVGDITVDAAIAAVAKTFGALPARPAADWRAGAARTTAFPAATASPVVLTHKGREDQAIAYMAWKTDDFFADVAKARTVRVLADILGLRMIEEIREKQGTTYSPSAGANNSSVFQGYGYVSASIVAEPSKVDPFFADVEKIAADLRNTPVTADELDRAKRPAIEALEKRFETNEFWLGQLSGAQADPRKLVSLRSARTGIAQVTAADIQAAARQYLTPDRLWKGVVKSDKAQ